ncbi:MAG: M48 family metallopeptidase [Xanthomonadales bacterium]|nr:M48 family metallopeptidase [Xanthomonadales bacterium]
MPYTIMHRPRITRRLHLELDENGGLVVVAPVHWSKRLITETLAHNMNRVEKFLAVSNNRHSKPLQYRAGEKHLYLGRAYRLVTHAARQNRVAVDDGTIHVWVTTPVPGKTRTVLQNWYRHEAGVVFQARLEEVSRRVPWTDTRRVLLQQRRMKRTWGNCSAGGLIKLNTHLVKAPVEIIDSVIAHELCHLEEMNHTAAFYNLLEQLNPNWKRNRACLRSKGAVYLRT